MSNNSVPNRSSSSQASSNSSQARGRCTRSSAPCGNCKCMRELALPSTRRCGLPCCNLRPSHSTVGASPRHGPAHSCPILCAETAQHNDSISQLAQIAIVRASHKQALKRPSITTRTRGRMCAAKGVWTTCFVVKNCTRIDFSAESRFGLAS